jgi:carboxylesterase type B
MIHLNTSQPLFKRAMCMSGTTLMRKPMTAEEEEKSYNAVLDALGIKDASPEDRIKAIMEVPFENFLAIPRSVGWAWGVDGDFVDKTLTHAELAALSGHTSEAISAIPAAASVNDLVLGDCQLDVRSSALQFLISMIVVNVHFIDFHHIHVSCIPQTWNR